MIELSYEGDIAVLRMAHGKANALDTKFMLELTDALDQIARSEAGGLVLTAGGGVFSAGVDLFQLMNGGRAYVAEFLPRMVLAICRLRPLRRAAVRRGHRCLQAVINHAVLGAGLSSVVLRLDRQG